MVDVTKILNQISTAPSEKQAFNAWLRMEDAVGFLKDNAQQDEFVVYAAMPFTFMHAILVPAPSVTPPNVDDLMAWNYNATASWGITVTFSEPRSVSISPPLDHTGSKTLDSGEQLVFARRFEGRPDEKSYLEALQKFVHVFDLHFLEGRNAYCRLDKHGDIEDVIRIVTIPAKGDEFGGTAVTCNRAVLDEYLALTDSTIVRTFDFTRYRPSHFGGWSDPPATHYTKEGDLFYRVHVEAGHACFMRGCQIVRCLTSKESIVERLDPTAKKERQHASFIAYDWKNKVVRDISCAPGETANYFTKSALPFELSPAFFKPDVLLKYKADQDKYRLQDRSISCRGAWHLETYDINEVGQVHTYLVYLRDLPYEEQLYWKSFNERPKGPISKRAIKTDFEGSWDVDYDPLDSLRDSVRELNRERAPWWTLRSEKLIGHLHYPVTASPDEWSNEILQLDQLVVEGFETRWLKNKAQALGRTPDPNFRSLKLVEECLIALGLAEGDAQKIVAPLRKTHDLRSKLKGHASGEEAAAIRKQTLAEHGSYKNHFHILCGECDEAVRTIGEAFKKLN
jgi:hypothetical protein